MITIKDWNEEELAYLRANFQKYTYNELANHLGKSCFSIKKAANALRMVKQPHKPWTKEEDDFLKEHYIDMTSAEIGGKLGRSVHSINARRDTLGLVRNPNWTKEEELYLTNNFKLMTYYEIGQVLKKTEQAVRAKCFDMNLYKKEPQWTNEDIEFLKMNYPFMCTKEIAEKLNRSIYSVTLKANRCGITKFPYYCDYHYFDEIDNEEKAYWLGFLTADGWISKKRDGNGKVTGLEIQYRDIEHLKDFNKALKGNYKITDRWRNCAISNNGTETHSCVLRIYSSIMHDKLQEYGFTYNKSFEASIPTLSAELYRHFIRGFFDGNGTISVSNTRLNVRFCTASKQMKDDLIRLLREEDIILKDYSEVNENGITVYYPEAIGFNDKISLLDYMYKDSTVSLSRKYKRYLKAKEKYNEQIRLPRPLEIEG